MTPAPERDFTSTGSLVTTVQRSVRSVELTAASLRIEPAMRLNGIPHFNARQVERIVAAMNGRDQSAPQAATAAAK